MSYNKKTWAEGDKITSAALNNMEDELEQLDASQPMTVSFVITEVDGQETVTADKTFAAVKAAVMAGASVSADIVWQGVPLVIRAALLSYGQEADTDESEPDESDLDELQFSAMVNWAEAGEDPEPVLLSITFKEDESGSISVIPLTPAKEEAEE